MNYRIKLYVCDTNCVILFALKQLQLPRIVHVSGTCGQTTCSCPSWERNYEDH
jgi:hypothetical protein